MKKFIFSLITFILLGITLGGGVFLLAGCDYSQSQEENNQENGNNSDSENGNSNEKINDDIENEENLENDDETEDSSYNFDFSVTSVFFYNGTHASYYGDWAMQYDDFYAYWRDQNGTNQNFNDITYREHGRNSSTVTESKGYQVYDVVYIHYDASGGLFAGSPKRYCAISATEGMYSVCGVYTSINNSYGRTRVARDLEVTSGGASGIYDFYIYGSGGLTTSESVAKSNASKNMSGNYYIYHRARYYAGFYNADGNNGYYNSKSLLSGVGYYLYSAPSRSGYVFTGWKDSSTNVVYSAGAYISDSLANKDRNFYAQWAPKIHLYSYYTSDYSTFTGPSSTGGTITMKYTSTSGSSLTASSIYNSTYNVKQSSSVTFSTTNKSGYLLRGWYTEVPTASNSPSKTTSFSFTASSNTEYYYYALFVRYKSITMYNRYTTTYDTISIGTTGGSIKVSYTNTSNSASSYTLSETSTAYSFTSVYSKTVSLTATANSGYQFVGWYSSSPSTSNESTYRLSTSTSYSFTASARSSVYGLFAKTYTLTVKYASGNYTHSTNITATNSTIGLNQTLSANGSYTLTTYCRPSSQTITISRANTSYTYYMGNGSATTGSLTNSFTYSWSTTANATVDVYVRERYTITYNGNGNTGGTVPSAAYKAHGLNITLGTNSLTRTGYTSNGWNPKADGTGTHYNNGATYSGNGNVTLYAQWTANTYYVKFNGNNATSGSMSNQTFTYDKAQNLTANAFSRTGYTFAGWATSASGLVAYTDKQSVKNLTSSNGATVNLYAKWNVVSYTITYDENGGNTVSDLSYTIESTSTLASTTRTGYTFNGWKPSASSGSWSSATTYKAGESVNGRYGSVTLVAQWTVNSYKVRIYAMAGINDITQPATSWYSDEVGRYKEVSVNYGTNYTISVTAKGAYKFDRWTTTNDSTASAVGTSNSYTFTVEAQNYTFYAWGTPNNPAYYDEAGGYWYVEIGMFPQTRATQTEISGIGSSNGNSYVISGKPYTAKIGANNTEFVQYNGVWYKVEPIKWRLTGNSSQKVGYGTTTDTMAIMDTIVYAGQFATSSLGIGQGYNNRATTSFENVIKNADNLTYLVSYSPSVESFGVSGVTTQTATDKIFISSEEEIQQVAGSYEVKFSDLVKDILGITIYFTRDMGTNINNVICRTEYGGLTQKFATSVQGFQFTIKVSEYGCVS